MAALIQCVPNFSEGRRADVLEHIVNSMASASLANIIDYSMDADHNRSVVTLLGSPDDVRKSMYAGTKAAVDLIDLNKHSGGHPRIGAVDVIPVVPISNITMKEAIALAHDIGKDIADGLEIPVYFYEECALRGHCVNLANIRKGGFEALKIAGLTGVRQPDLGPSEVHPTAGAVVVGARGPLIAFNVNLATDNIHIAREIAAKIRKLRDQGKEMIGVKAIAVLLHSRSIAQVSTNITQPHLTEIYDVFSFIEQEAKAMGVEVLESELIGAIRQSLPDEAVKSMKLPTISQNRIIDYWIQRCS